MFVFTANSKVSDPCARSGQQDMETSSNVTDAQIQRPSIITPCLHTALVCTCWIGSSLLL